MCKWDVYLFHWSYQIRDKLFNLINGGDIRDASKSNSMRLLSKSYFSLFVRFWFVLWMLFLQLLLGLQISVAIVLL